MELLRNKSRVSKADLTTYDYYNREKKMEGISRSNIEHKMTYRKDREK